MAVKILKQNAPIDVDPCSSPFKSSISQFKFFNSFSKMAQFISKNNSGKEEITKLSTPVPSTTTQLSKSCELQRMLCYFDENGDGMISPSELCSCMRATGEELSLEDAKEAVRLSDSDGDGQLGLEDFVKLIDGEDEQQKDKNLMDAFRMYEMDGRGCITPKSLRRMLRRLGQYPTVEDCIIMIGQFDLDGDGVLSFEEFKIMMQ